MDKPKCKYGSECYQKNPVHKEKYAHPATSTNDINSSIVPVAQASTSSSDSQDTSCASNQITDVENQMKQVMRYKRPSTPEKEYDNEEEDGSKHEYHGIKRQRYRLPKIPIDIGMMNDLYDPQIEFSKQSEYNELCEDPVKFIKYKFLVAMPSCFYVFWEFCKEQAKNMNTKPEDVLLQIGLKMVGPFDVLADKFKGVTIHEPGDYLRHWRFFYDPPEFQTVIVKKDTGIHYGYWRDDPDNTDGLVASNDVSKGCEFKIVGENLFDALMHYLDEKSNITPFNKQNTSAMKKNIEAYCHTKGILLKCNDKQNIRNKLIVCKTFHKAGLVVPYDRKKDVGYRPLLESDSKLRIILSKFDKVDRTTDKKNFEEAMRELQSIITAANLAVDECDFGTALELALDLFCHGSKSLHEIMKPLFYTGYSMVKRPQYIAIIKSHLDKRSEGTKLDLLAHE
ncbi:histone PARylation factor 1-like [Anopheles nili]|uniref:histone PARylation factor 1-like n=1 Tax=Anopheles nili TaxID=185578 RepID=UPI00237BB192|nr:histone PARylation factor 1-like [Anopheles nili]